MSATVSNPSEASMETALKSIPKIDVLRNTLAALGAGQRTFGMIREFLALGFGAGRLTPAEYFYYRLWEKTPEERRCFVGKVAQENMHLACNDLNWFAATQDKLLYHAAMIGAGFPVPKLLAVHHATRKLTGALSLTSADEIASFLRRPHIYPVFGKPIDGLFSLGAFSAESWRAEDDTVAFYDGTRQAVGDFAAHLAQRQSGHMLQQKLITHPVLEAIFGRRLASVRMFVLLTGQGPVVARAVCKIPVGRNVADNFWRNGNMLGAVDIESGEIKRVVRGTGADMVVNPEHPDTGRAILGLRLPQWNQLKELCQTAALTLPGVRTQGWDIAITRDGPVLLEVNFGGDLNLAQLAWGAGVLDDTYRAHLRACGYQRSV